MNNQTHKLRGSCGRTAIAGAGWRAGITKQQLIAIMCGAALVGAVAATVGLLSSPKSKLGPGTWQCLDCEDDFTSETTDMPPIECPQCDGQAVRFTVSIGIAVVKPEESDFMQTMRRADHALYRAKKTGRNRVCVEEESRAPANQN